MDLEARIRQRAATLGFGACGFATAAPLERGAFLEGWLAAGFAGEMRYLEWRPERRLTVAGVVPGARTVISLVYPYDPPPAPAIDWRADLRGRIAAYALREDYHRVIERELAALEAFIAAECPGSRTRRYVDTGPILEREWAVRGGLGWFGKNTALIDAPAGSWFLLAELVTTAPLVADLPAASRCGSCTRCLAACPTGALRDGLVMDARLCISYLTIEHRTAIPRPLRSKLGPWIFGCDICQEVCPWNDKRMSDERKPQPIPGPQTGRALERSARANAAADWARLDRLFPSLPELLALDDRGFRARFARTPVTRAKRRGLLRNVAVALGNSGNPAALPALSCAIADPEPLVRGHAAWALGKLRDRKARRLLERAHRVEHDPAVLAEIATALVEFGSPSN